MSSPGGNKSWELSEFDKHLQRLQDVGKQVSDANKTMNDVHGKNGEAFGKLFGWIVAPAIDLITADTGEFSTSLATAMSASSDGIGEARTAYEQTEQDNVDRSKQVEASLQKQKGRLG